MMLPKVITIAVVVFTFFIYLLISKRKRRNIRHIDDYLFYNRSLNNKGFTRTFVATGISLATVLAFFLDFGGQFGFAIILSPIAYIVGVWVFLRVLKPLAEDGYITRGSTLHSFLGLAFKSDIIRLTTAVVSLLGYIGILVIELHVGVQIFRLFSSNTAFLVCVVLIFMTLIYTYTWLAGYQAVVDTDRIQLWLILMATIAGLSFLSVKALLADTLPPWEQFFPTVWKLPIALIVVIIVGNVPLQILRMSNWQRAAAVGNVREVRLGLVRAIKWTFLFWLMFCVLGIFLGSVDASGSTEIGNLRLLLVANKGGMLSATIVVPLLFAGMIAALVSTADSILVPILTAWIYDFRFHRKLHEEGLVKPINDTEGRKFLQSAKNSIPFFLIITIILYWALVWYARFDFVSLLFVFFNQQLVLFPAVLIALDPQKDGLKRLVPVVLIAVIAGWSAVWITTYLGVRLNNQDLVFYASALGFGIASMIPLITARGRLAMWRSLKRLF